MIHFIKVGGQLKPMYKSDLEAWNKIKENVPYAMRYKRDRNYEFHQKLFAICKTIIENLPDENIWANKTPYAMIKAAEIDLGYIEQITLMDGNVSFVPESIDFENWGEDKFNEFYEKCVPYLCEKFGYDRTILENNLD